MIEERETRVDESGFLPMPDGDALELTTVLQALADPVRLRIVRELADAGELSCGRLSLPVSASTRSHHLKTLRAAGVTRTRMVGTQRLVSLRSDVLERRFPGLLAAVLDSPR